MLHPDTLASALVDGALPERITAHVATLLEEAHLSLIVAAVEEVAAMVIEREPQALATAGTFLSKHRDIFLQEVEQRKLVLKAQFDAIDVLDFRTSYELAAQSARAFLMSL